MLVFYALGTLPGIQYVYIAFGLAPIILYKKKFLLVWILFSLINFSLFVISDVTEISLVPADFNFPEELITPFRISLILTTVFAISSFFSAFYGMIERKAQELNKLNKNLIDKNLLISEHEVELTGANDQLLASLAALEEQQKLLQQANATKDKFFSIIAHDLKNPLSSIIGFSDILYKSNGGIEIEEQKAYIHTISETSRSLYDLLENLLQWSRIQTGRISFQPLSFPLIEAVISNMSLMEATKQQKSITIHNNVDPGTVVFADYSMVTTVLRNLLSNALKFTREQGNISVTNERFKNMMKVSVSDDGVGIDPARGGKLFQIEEDTSTKGTSGEGGTGLGLILCREFIELNKGKLGFESEEGKGTTFWFTLLLEEPKET